ncbi:beta-ribofuranosylaminobenzene 5'-phosphate synthase family protein [Variovorax sp. PBL-H6]|uniref:beta-ribofuranosylaminobenzene 5'-phosphate synthase family protein n=1 Tax=Variovorax sp. PBL-H6 TaxID=434009 RepID=UPI001317CE77|nr:beta-ribofuranosylaminobenzene 5'-phosphate synthase family protein [Variovorax sp. PBL-H6]VTU31391.1 beta-ribofuranosylaminobenzene 5'-phosphate synthase family protein [Variovorax sp. PBL-H6]
MNPPATAALASRRNLAVRTVRVGAPGRLHLGFLDPSGSLGRPFGSLGLVIDGFTTEVELTAAESDCMSGDTPTERAELERAGAFLRLLRQRSGRHAPLCLRLLQVLPSHAGFGSGTQLACAIGRAFDQWHGLGLSTATLAHWLGRGLRSGVGIAGFDAGGLLVDGGPGRDGLPAPLLSRVEFPRAWRIVLVQDPSHRGLSGGDEKKAIAVLPPLPRAGAADICHQVLMRILPAAASAEFAPFAEGINRMQELLGQHFGPAQGGAFTSPAVGRLMQWIADADRGGQPGPQAAIGQSSWGPTGFAILPSQAQADALVKAAHAAAQVDAGLQLRIVSGRNHAAVVRDVPSQPHAD